MPAQEENRRLVRVRLLRPPEVLAVPLKEAVAKLKLVPTDGDLVRTARSIGVSFGDE
jgi:6-phosphofructokinase 1